MDARQFVGRAPEQVDAFVENVVGPIRKEFAAELRGNSETVRV
jgi:adenylosuccinate lyase